MMWFLLMLIVVAQGASTDAANPTCDGASTCVLSTLKQISGILSRVSKILTNGGEQLMDKKTYYIKSLDGKFAVVDKTKQLVFMKVVPITGASVFTAFRKSCNVYGLCAEGACISRCNSCKSDTGDGNTVKVHLSNSDEPYSQWTFQNAVSSSDGIGGPYTLKSDGSYGYIAIKKTTNNDYQLTLSTTISDDTKFDFIEV